MRRSSAAMFLVGIIVSNLVWATETVTPAEFDQLNMHVTELYHQGQYEHALSFARRAVAIGKELYGEEHPKTAMSLHNLAALYFYQGDYAQAELLFKRTLAIREKVLGSEHPDTAQCLNNLAEVYSKRRD